MRGTIGVASRACPGQGVRGPIVDETDGLADVAASSERSSTKTALTSILRAVAPGCLTDTQRFAALGRSTAGVRSATSIPASWAASPTVIQLIVVDEPRSRAIALA